MVKVGLSVQHKNFGNQAIINALVKLSVESFYLIIVKGAAMFFFQGTAGVGFNGFYCSLVGFYCNKSLPFMPHFVFDFICFCINFIIANYSFLKELFNARDSLCPAKLLSVLF